MEDARDSDTPKDAMIALIQSEQARKAAAVAEQEREQAKAAAAEEKAAAKAVAAEEKAAAKAVAAEEKAAAKIEKDQAKAAAAEEKAAAKAVAAAAKLEEKERQQAEQQAARDAPAPAPLPQVVNVQQAPPSAPREGFVHSSAHLEVDPGKDDETGHHPMLIIPHLDDSEIDENKVITKHFLSTLDPVPFGTLPANRPRVLDDMCLLRSIHAVGVIRSK